MVEKLNQPVENLENEIDATLKDFSKERNKLKDKILKWRKDKEQEKFTLTDEEKKEILDKLEKDNPAYKQKLEIYNETSTVIDFSNTEITDEQMNYTRPLIKTFSSMIELKLNNNKLTYIDYIQELPNMKILDLSGNQIQPLENSEIFFGCTSLEELNLSENSVIDLNAMYYKNIRSTLKILKINNNKDAEYTDIKLSSLQWLENFILLENLEARNNNIAESKFFANLPNLQELYLSDNLLVNLNDMKGLPNLTIIDISNNKFWNLGLVQSWAKDISKWLITNKWSSINGLKRFSSLEKIIIDDEVMTNDQYLKFIEWGNRLWLEDQRYKETWGKSWTEVVREKINEERIRF